MTDLGYVTQAQLKREAARAARVSARERGFRFAKVNFWAVAPGDKGYVRLVVQVTASNPDGNFAQFPVYVAC